MCKFAIVPPASVVAMLNMVTGWELKLPDVIIAGERVYNLKRLINQRFGMTSRMMCYQKGFLLSH